MAIESPYAARLAEIPVVADTVEVLGSATRYWSYGPADAAVTIVLVHGYRGEHHGIEPIVAFLPGIRFLSPDLPGFGESSPFVGREHSAENYALWLAAFMDALGVTGSAYLLGHSFGSIVAATAVADGLTTRGLILVNPIAISGLAGPRRIATAITVGYYGLASRLPARLGYALLRSTLIVRAVSIAMVKTDDVSLRRWVHDQHDRYFSRFANRDVVVEGFAASVSHAILDLAARLIVPTLLVAAAQDDITPLRAQRDLLAALPDGELTVIDGVGHLIHYETPQPAAAAIAAFIERTNAR
jgi:pimeloyl-ACP methyl ester carboxylesterase